MTKQFWTYERDFEIKDYEFDSASEADEQADEDFAHLCQDFYEPRDGETFDERITLIRFFYDEKDERVILERVKSIVEYTHYADDRSEHFRQSDYL